MPAAAGPRTGTTWRFIGPQYTGQEVWLKERLGSFFVFWPKCVSPWISKQLPVLFPAAKQVASYKRGTEEHHMKHLGLSTKLPRDAGDRGKGACSIRCLVTLVLAAGPLGN